MERRRRRAATPNLNYTREKFTLLVVTSIILKHMLMVKITGLSKIGSSLFCSNIRITLEILGETIFVRKTSTVSHYAAQYHWQPVTIIHFYVENLQKNKKDLLYV